MILVLIWTDFDGPQSAGVFDDLQKAVDVLGVTEWKRREWEPEGWEARTAKAEYQAFGVTPNGVPRPV